MNTVSRNKFVVIALGSLLSINLSLYVSDALGDTAYSDRWDQQAVRPEYIIKNSGNRGTIADYSDKAQLARANSVDLEQPEENLKVNDTESNIDSHSFDRKIVDDGGSSVDPTRITSIIEQVTSKAASEYSHLN